MEGRGRRRRRRRISFISDHARNLPPTKGGGEREKNSGKGGGRKAGWNNLALSAKLCCFVLHHQSCTRSREREREREAREERNVVYTTYKLSLISWWLQKSTPISSLSLCCLFLAVRLCLLSRWVGGILPHQIVSCGCQNTKRERALWGLILGFPFRFRLSLSLSATNNDTNLWLLLVAAAG